MERLQEARQEPSNDEGIEIVATVARKVTFATHQNDIPVIADLSIRNGTEEQLENLTLRLTSDTGLIGARKWTIDRVAANGEIRLRDRKVHLEGAKLAELNERLASTLSFELFQGDQLLASREYPVIGLARNEWGGAHDMPELLAAFVTPNDPAVSRIQKDAGEVLRRSGRQPALDGYQSKSRKRVWEMVSAIWAAVCERRFVYAEPPASFETEGQKIRLPSAILEDGLMTCLDSALLFAAVAEQCGLNSVVVFTKGHAFTGVWLQPQELPTLTVDDATDIRKYLALQDLVLFETTMAVHEPPVAFPKAVAEAKRLVAEENEADFVYALDVKRARARQISPLPTTSRIETAPGQEKEQIKLAVDAPPEDLPGFDIGVTVSEVPETPQTRLDHWQRRLLDLTKRNRLLNLKKSKTAISLLCHAPDVLEDKLADGKKITVVPMMRLRNDGTDRDESLFRDRTGDDLRSRYVEEALQRNEVVSDLDDKDLESGLIQLYRKAKSDLKEGGANTLFLALGMLKWRQKDDNRAYRAPLILLPVTLERASARSKVRISLHDDETVFNMTLLEMLKQDFDISMPELHGSLPQDESGVDVRWVWRYVQQKVRDVPGFEVVEEIVLSTFSFAKFLMWKDLAARTEQLKSSNLVKHLIETPREPYAKSASFIRCDQIDEKIDPKELFMPLPADASQITAVHASTLGGDFVLEGPPGTGKSQTIANIIAQNLALGKKVLFVSEKMAALEVVYKRLKDVGLGDFCLELHSNKANKKDVLQQLGKSWHNRSTKTREDWERLATNLKEVRNELNRFVKALHERCHSGITPYEAMGRTVRFRDVHPVRLGWQGQLGADLFKSRDTYEAALQRAAELGAVWSNLSDEDKAAFADLAQTEWSMEWQREAVRKAKVLISQIDGLRRCLSKFVGALKIDVDPQTVGQVDNVVLLAKQVPQAAENDLSFALDSDGQQCLSALEKAISELSEYKKGKQRLSTTYSDTKIASAPLAEWRSAWERAQESWALVSALRRYRIRRRAAKFGSLNEKPQLGNDLPVLAELQRLAKHFEQFGIDYPTVKLWRGPDSDQARLEACLSSGRLVRSAVAQLASDLGRLPELRRHVYAAFVDGRELLMPEMPVGGKAAELRKTSVEFKEALSEFSKHVGMTVDEMTSLDVLLRAATGVAERESRLRAWCEWQLATKHVREHGLGPLVAALEEGEIKSQDCVEALRTAYAEWVAGRLVDARPELKDFSPVKHESRIDRYRDLDEKLSRLSVDYIRAKLSGGIPSPDSPTRSAGYGVLAHELRKKMRHKPIRELVGEMGPALTALTPCLMMSPLSVAQFLSADAGPLFDLVVFDEASQITVWDAIGAIARGKNAIIVGDPKQMPPTSFFDRSAEDEDDTETEDLESVLDEALASSVRWHRLTGHYRSRHESLIAFSNHRYYDGDLVTYPSSTTLESSVHFRKVEGIYQRGSGRTNPEEAKAVVAEVVSRLKGAGERYQSIGVVTLNSEQQRLIDDLLDDERRKDPSLEPFFSDDMEEPVFVKNLETVQGDQRDVILLSVGYGPDAPGANTMSMNFGPLNRKGGERRLNVAITRATTEVMVFASFDPSMIDLSRTSAAAVRDLKHYIEFAERGPKALGEAIQSIGGYDQYDSEFEHEVADQLRRRGWTVQTQIGVSKFRVDLGVVHPDEPGKFLAGIECDGATYHSLPSARDRDRVRQAILEGLGWKLCRIWSTDYFVDPRSSIDKLHLSLVTLLGESRAEVGSRTKTEECKSEINGVEEVTDSEHALPPIIEPVEPGEAVLEAPSELSPQNFYENRYRKTIRDYAAQIINRLGPITFAHLCEVVARAHGFQRTGKQIKGQIWGAISRAVTHTRAPDQNTILWPEGMVPCEMLEYRGLDVSGSERKWNQVPYPEKLGLAMQAIQTCGASDPLLILRDRIGVLRLTERMSEELTGLLSEASKRLTVEQG